MDPLTILAALGPLVIEGGKAAIQRWLAPDEFKPANMEQYVQMRQIDLDMFKAMNEAGGTNQSYLWVEAVVRLMRPVAVIVVIGTWSVLALQDINIPAVDNFASAIGFYLFGDRTLFYAKKAIK